MKNSMTAGFAAGLLLGWSGMAVAMRSSSQHPPATLPPRSDDSFGNIHRVRREWGDIVAVCDPGKVRETNEDRALLLPLAGQRALVAVADGMGGHQGGSVASGIAIDALRRKAAELPPSDVDEQYEFLLEAFEAADAEIRAASGPPELAGMGTTLVAAVINPRDCVYAYSGDSRLYHIRNCRLLHRTRDHSVVQVLLDERMITDEEARRHPARSRLTACLGGSRQIRRLVIEPRWEEDATNQAYHLPIARGDIVILCSDGLHGDLDEDTILRLAIEQRNDSMELVRSLLRAALDAGGNDNISLIAAKWH